MKLRELALQNIKRNINKYFMYFFSLCFSVFTAYSFLALIFNEYILMVFNNDLRYRNMIIGFGIIIMIFVLFFLISSNKNFIKARKKEISTYALFGMSNGKIGKLLFIETAFIGGVALMVGIGLGILFSKLMTMFLLQMTFRGLSEGVKFVISIKSVWITIVIFSAIFSAMGLSGLRVINKFELIDLFRAEKVSEGHPKGSLLLLGLAIILLSFGYGMAINSDASVVVQCSIPILILVILGTFLFFWSGIPRLLSIIKKSSKYKYNGIKLISTAALSHRMKSISSIMATIAILSAVATTAIATGFTLYRNSAENTYQFIGHDLIFTYNDESVYEEVTNIITKNNSKVQYENSLSLHQGNPFYERIQIPETSFYYETSDIYNIFSQSSYEELYKNSKTTVERIRIKDGEAVYIYPYLSDHMANTLPETELFFKDSNIIIAQTIRTGVACVGNKRIIIVTDEDYEKLKVNNFIQNTGQKLAVFNYSNALNELEIYNELYAYLEKKAQSFGYAYSLNRDNMMTFGLVCFIGFFMSGVIVLINASLLYFKQVTAAEEERHHFVALRKLGLSKEDEKKVVTRRLLPVFIIPLILGIIHSIFAMKSADTIVFSNIIPIANSYIRVLSFSSIMYGIYVFVYAVFYFIAKGQYLRIIKRA